MIKLLLTAILQRIIDLFLTCVSISAVIALLCIMGIIPDGSRDLTIGLLIGTALFLLINARMLRRCYFEMRDITLYYVVNYCAYVIFGAFNLCTYKLFSSAVYAWLFAVTKFARYIGFNISSPLSATIFHIIMVILIFSIPFSTGRIFSANQAKADAGAQIPPRLKVNPLESDRNKAEEPCNQDKNGETDTEETESVPDN